MQNGNAGVAFFPLENQSCSFLQEYRVGARGPFPCPMAETFPLPEITSGCVSGHIPCLWESLSSYRGTCRPGRVCLGASGMRVLFLSSSCNVRPVICVHWGQFREGLRW